MKGYLRDFWRPFRSLMVIVPIVALGAIAGAFGVTDQPAPKITAFADWYDQGLHFVFFVGSETGQPLSGVSLSIQVSSFNSTLFPTGFTASYQSTTGADGLAWVLAEVPSTNYSVSWYANSSSGSLSESGVATPGPNGADVGLGGYPFQAAKVGFLTTQGALFVLLAGPNGSSPNGYPVQYALVNKSSPLQWVTLGTMDGYYDVFPLAFPPSSSPGVGPNGSSTGRLPVTFQALYPNGSVALSENSSTGDLNEPLAHFPEVAGPTGQATSVVSFLTTVMATFVGFIAVLLGFSQYGRDRVTRVLDSVLWRPVTQPGLLLERYASAVVPVAIVSIVSVLSLDAGLDAAWKVTLPPNFLVVVFAALTGMAAAFIGVVFLASRVLRSVGSLVGMAVGMLVVFFVLWTPVLAFFSASGTGPGSPTASAALVNPALMPILTINALTTSTFAVGTLSTVHVAPPTAVVVSAAAVWVLLPIIFASVLARLRD